MGRIFIWSYLTTKQLLEAKLNIKLKVDGVKSKDGLLEKASQYKAHNIIYRPEGGVVELLKILKKRRVNRLNTEVTLLLTPELMAHSKQFHASIAGSCSPRQHIHHPAA
ncbi:MAG: hypothetical protein HRU09_16370 [Oligoflexales bacterium]|nr:hypothetical protein [Oligoflexales bacterium]